jgi:hypothetical protein
VFLRQGIEQLVPENIIGFKTAGGFGNVPHWNHCMFGYAEPSQNGNVVPHRA